MTSDTGPEIRYVVDQVLAKELFHDQKALTSKQCEEVSWRDLYETLNDKALRLFTLWACKQVIEVAAMNDFLIRTGRGGDRSSKCPCCGVVEKMAENVLYCEEAEKVDFMNKSVEAIENWLEGVDTCKDLQYYIMEYIEGRWVRTMTEVCSGLGARFMRLGRS